MEDINRSEEREREGDINLISAVKSGAIERVKSLSVQPGVKLEDVDAEGRTALHCAIEFQDLQFVSVLLEAGANVEAQSRLHGDTPLALACRHGKEEIAEYLLDKHARVEGAYGLPINVVQSPSPEQLLEEVGGASASNVEPLVESEAFAVEREERATPLMLAVKSGISKIVQSLIIKDANVYAQDINNWTALHYAAKGGNFFFIDVLLSRQENRGLLEMVNVDNDTPLIVAAKHGQVGALLILCLWKCEVNAIGQNERTALGWAAHHGHKNCVESLLDNNADISVIDEDGKTPLQLAKDLFDKEWDANIILSEETMEKCIKIICMLEEHQRKS